MLVDVRSRSCFFWRVGETGEGEVMEGMKCVFGVGDWYDGMCDGMYEWAERVWCILFFASALFLQCPAPFSCRRKSPHFP